MRVVDSHTAGQPTRIIVDGSPDLGVGSMSERRDNLRSHLDRFRTATVGEPRGSDQLVGGILCRPADPSCETGVIFFDNTGYVDISGHGLIGLAVSLEYLGRFAAGEHRVETPAGVVTLGIPPTADFSLRTVPSFRTAKNVTVKMNGSQYRGDIAWGGSWCYVVNDHQEDLDISKADRLMEVARSIRRALAKDKITGPGGEEVTDVALFGKSQRRDANSRNFVLRASKTYRRCPSGTALSAKLACLHEDGALAEGQNWRQESIIGTMFDGSVSIANGTVLPVIRSTAHVTSESTLIMDERDPYCWGLS